MIFPVLWDLSGPSPFLDLHARVADFAASLGLVPRQMGTGGKVRLGPISKRGNGYLRRLLVNGAMSVLNSKRAKQDPWLIGLLERKPRKLAVVSNGDNDVTVAGVKVLVGHNVGM